MAGGGAAYTRLKKTSDEIGQNLRYFAGLDQQEILQNKKQLDDINTRREKEIQDEYNKGMSSFIGSSSSGKNVLGLDSPTMTTDGNFNKMSFAFAESVHTNWLDLAKKLKNYRDKYDRSGIQATNIEIESLNKAVRNYKMMESTVADWIKNTDVSKLNTYVEDGSIQLLKDLAEHKAIMKVEKDSNGLYKTFVEGSNGYKVPLEDFVSGKATPFKRFDLSKDAYQLKEKLKVVEKELKAKAGYTKYTKGYDEKIIGGALDNMIDNMLDNERMSWYLAKIHNGDKRYSKKSGFTDEDYKEVKQYLKNTVIGMFGYSEKDKVDEAYWKKKQNDLGWYNAKTGRKAVEKPKNKKDIYSFIRTATDEVINEGKYSHLYGLTTLPLEKGDKIIPKKVTDVKIFNLPNGQKKVVYYYDGGSKDIVLTPESVARIISWSLGGKDIDVNKALVATPLDSGAGGKSVKLRRIEDVIDPFYNANGEKITSKFADEDVINSLKSVISEITDVNDTNDWFSSGNWVSFKDSNGKEYKIDVTKKENVMKVVNELLNNKSNKTKMPSPSEIGL